MNEFAERPRRPVRLLLINPNTSEHITRRMELSARRVLPADTTLTAITAIEGPQAVRSAADVAYATANVHRMAQVLTALGFRVNLVSATSRTRSPATVS